MTTVSPHRPGEKERIWSGFGAGGSIVSIVKSFLLEAYLGSVGRAEIDAVARRAQGLEAGGRIRYWGSLVLLEDEICFHIFEAPSERVLLEAIERVALEHDRVVETVWIPSYPAARRGADLERT